jgi:multiple sugar transport system substrate-binding protein
MNMKIGGNMTKSANKGLSRRNVLAASAAVAATGLARPAIAQGKPEKLVFVGDNGPWHWTVVEEVGPAFEKANGIKVEFTLLPIDPLNARLHAELTAASGGIDVVQWTNAWGGWLAPYMEDHQALMSKASMPSSAGFDWADFLPATQKMATYDGKLLGIPYRTTMNVLQYQKPLFADVGIAKPPENWDEFVKAAIELTKAGAPDRYGYGIMGRQGPAIEQGYEPYLFGNGGWYYDPKTYEILINNDKAVEALEFYGDLMTKYKVIPPAALTWEFDEIVANGQNDRFAMSCTLAPYGSLFNDPKLSKTGGRWGAAVAPGRHSVADSRVAVGGWSFGVPVSGRNKEYAFEFIQMATSKAWQRRSMERGNCSPRGSVLNDPSVVAQFPWTPAAAAALKNGLLVPSQPIWPTLEAALRSGISAVLLGQKTAKVALDGVASDWQRSMRRAGLI